MNPALFLRGILIGISIAAPVGPIGVLCIRRTLADGRASGLATGLGAATADAVYGCVAALGLTALTGALTAAQTGVRLVGGAVLLGPGVRAFLSRAASRAADSKGGGLLGAYVSTFLLTLTNPMTILSFLAVFAALGLGATRGDPWAAATLVLGVLLGSALWWLLLSLGVGLLRARVDARGLRWVNRISGAVIVAFGIAAIGSVLARST